MINIDSVVYRNMMSLIEKNGISEHMCIMSCGLNSNFFVNYRQGKTKHFKICDLVKIAAFFGVTPDYLCRYENINDEPFRRKYVPNPTDEKILLNAIRRLSPEGRIHLADFLHNELKKESAGSVK